MRRISTAVLALGVLVGLIAAPITASAVPAETAASTAKTTVSPYFFVDEAGHPNRTGPFLVPVKRAVPATVAVGTAALEELLDGPKKSEKNASPAISTQIPDGTKLVKLTIANGTAKVYFNNAFAGDDDSAAAALRAAQVVFTLTRFPTVERVSFFQGGDPIKVQTDKGNLRHTVQRKHYRDFMAAISLETPVYGGVTEDLVRVSGEAAVFEATFLYKLEDASGKVLEKGIAMSDNGAGWGDFDFTIHYTVDERQTGQLKVWTYSAKDGSKIDVRKYPIILKP